MIELTKEQRELLSREPTPIRDPETGETYILLRTEVYERMRALLEDTVHATGELVDRVMAEDNARDPYLAEYQRLYGDPS
jgi:hypothetical protein